MYIKNLIELLKSFEDKNKDYDIVSMKELRDGNVEFIVTTDSLYGSHEDVTNIIQ